MQKTNQDFLYQNIAIFGLTWLIPGIDIGLTLSSGVFNLYLDPNLSLHIKTGLPMT